MQINRILVIGPLPPPIHGSAMVTQQIKDCALINDNFICDYVNLSTSRKMAEIQNFSIQKIFRLLAIYFRLLWLLLTHRYDLCYCAIACFGVPFIKDAPVVLLCKLFCCKVLIHQHNKGMSRYCEKSIYKQLYHWVYGNTKVMLLSWRLYDDIAQVVNRNQILICPNGVKLMGMDKGIERNHKIPHILYLSNLIPSKGCLDLLEACKVLKEKGFSFVCDFVGGDCPEMSEANFKNAIVDRNLDGCVIYHGRKYGADKDAFFRAADIFAFPTYYPAECFPLVLLEAMQYELPCVTTSEAAIPDIITDGVNGLICEAKNAESLALKLEELLLNPKQRGGMGIMGREKIEKEFTEDIFEKRFCECIKGMLNLTY